jgi:3-oxoacyl-[acyl-carrier protein] reductase
MSKIVCITGGSRGLGKEMALQCADAGYDLWLTYQSSDDKAKAVQQEVESKGVSCQLLKFNIADPEETHAVLGLALKEATPWALVNNAGITKDGLFMRMKQDQWESVVDTNLNGFFNVTQPMVAAMMKKKEGRIVNISSVVGQAGNPGQVNYAATKAGMIGATKALALEVARRNILVNAIAPGFIETEMTEDLDTDAMLKSIPLGRLGEPRHIADLAMFLLSHKADYITGQVFGVNGGMYL